MWKVTVYRTKDQLFRKLANLLTDVDTVLSDKMLLGVISVCMWGRHGAVSVQFPTCYVWVPTFGVFERFVTHGTVNRKLSYNTISSEMVRITQSQRFTRRAKSKDTPCSRKSYIWETNTEINLILKVTNISHWCTN